jgi:hypothetical protein
VYVSDAIRACVQKFSPEGKFLAKFGQPGDRPGDFVRPKQIGVGSDGHVHVVDAGFYNVQVFDDQGQVVGFYGAPGPHPGSMDLPAGLEINETDLDLFQKYVHPAFEAERLVLVTNNFGNQKVSVYAMGHLKADKTVADIMAGRVNVMLAASTTQPANMASSTQPAFVDPLIKVSRGSK